MEGGGRASNELRSLCDFLWAAKSHDQLNLGALASVEIQCRRVAVVSKPTATRSTRAGWRLASMAEGSQSDAAIAPALVAMC